LNKRVKIKTINYQIRLCCSAATGHRGRQRELKCCRLSNRKRSRKKHAVLAAKQKAVASGAGGVDLESSGEFSSVEKMLATTDANRFTTYLQSGELGGKRGEGGDTQHAARGRGRGPHRLSPRGQTQSERPAARRKRAEPERR